MKRKNVLLLPATALAIALTACAGLPFGSSKVASSGWVDWDGSEGWSGEMEALGAPAAEKALGAIAEPLESSVMLEEASDELASRSEQSPSLRAGSVDDNAEWDDYLLYRLKFKEWGVPVHDLDVSERHVIRVENTLGNPILGAAVQIGDPNGDSRTQLSTHSNGRVLFFPEALDWPSTDSFKVTVRKDGAEASETFSRQEREHIIILDSEPTSTPVHLDVHFLIDATGSMSDEIQRLKDNMVRVAERVADLPAQPSVRFGMTVYRDRGDLFVSRTLEFTGNTGDFTNELAAIQADGGGDYPESLNEGFHNAIHLPEWRGEDTISLVFLIADAPPHLDYAQDYDYAADIWDAVEQGIKIYPIASSGLDDQGEYIFRQLAQISGGKFLFLTYGADGAPGDETTHHVDDYSVLALDDLVVRVISDEISALEATQ